MEETAKKLWKLFLKAKYVGMDNTSKIQFKEVWEIMNKVFGRKEMIKITGLTLEKAYKKSLG